MSSETNTKEGMNVTPEDEYWAFDQLSPRLRSLLRNLPLDVSAFDALSYLEEGMSEEELISNIKSGCVYWMNEIRDDCWPMPNEKSMIPLRPRKRTVQKYFIQPDGAKAA